MPSPKCVASLLVRNEAGEDRYLRRVLANCALFCDEIVVLDDHSTDETVAICRAADKVVAVESTESQEGGWWKGGSEFRARQQLWALACQHAGPDGWVLVMDADQELLGIAPEEFRELLHSEAVDCWAFPLWDCWESDQWQRVDGYWKGWAFPRVWLARALPGTWNDRGVHSGHLPTRNWTPGNAPIGAGIAHYGYIKREHRLRKMEKYVSLGTI